MRALTAASGHPASGEHLQLPDPNRRAVSIGLAAAPLLAGLTRPATAQGLRTVRIQVQNPMNLSDYPHLVAERSGIFARHGIKGELVTVQNGVLALLAGEVDITTVGSANGMVAQARKQDLQFLAVTVSQAVLALLVRPDDPLTAQAHRWPDAYRALRGKKVGVTVAGGLLDQMARWMAVSVGLTPDKDIVIHPAGDASILIASLEKGVYDAALQISPYIELALQRKSAVSIMDFYKGEGPPELKNFPFATPAAKGSFVDANRDLINRYLRAMQEALDYARKAENRTVVLDMVAKELKVDPKSLEGPIGTFVGALGTVKFSRRQWDAALSMMRANGMTEEISYEKGVFAGARA